jgi:transposase
MASTRPRKGAVKAAEETAPVTPAASRVRAYDPTANGRARRRSAEKLADLSPPVCAEGTSTRSKGAINAEAKERSTMRHVALDLGSKKTTYCEVSQGEVVQRGAVTQVETLSTVLGPEQPEATVAIEACREAWYVYDLLQSWGNRVVLVDTTRSRQLGIGRHGRKTDRIDAEVLARALERGGIPAAHVLSPERRELRRVLGIRRALVETRAQYVTTVRGLARENGIKLGDCRIHNFAARVRGVMQREPSLQVTEPLLKMLDLVCRELEGVEAELTQLSAREPVIQHLCTVPGVGPVVAAVFVSVVDDAKRFQRAHQLESYLGLVPGEHSSGGKRRVGAITKKGNSYLRGILVQASWALLLGADDDDPLKRWTEAIAARRGKRVAVIALARRLAGILWALWRDQSVYDPQTLGRKAARGLRSLAAETQFRAEALERAARKRFRPQTTREVATLS